MSVALGLGFWGNAECNRAHFYNKSDAVERLET